MSIFRFLNTHGESQDPLFENIPETPRSILLPDENVQTEAMGFPVAGQTDPSDKKDFPNV